MEPVDPILAVFHPPRPLQRRGTTARRIRLTTSPGAAAELAPCGAHPKAYMRLVEQELWRRSGTRSRAIDRGHLDADLVQVQIRLAAQVEARSRR
jgi:hypothetical protein